MSWGGLKYFLCESNTASAYKYIYIYIYALLEAAFLVYDTLFYALIRFA